MAWRRPRHRRQDRAGGQQAQPTQPQTATRLKLRRIGIHAARTGEYFNVKGIYARVQKVAQRNFDPIVAGQIALRRLVTIDGDCHDQLKRRNCRGQRLKVKHQHRVRARSKGRQRQPQTCREAEHDRTAILGRDPTGPQRL